MSKSIWSKTAIAQAIGLTVVGATTATDALAQDNKATHLRITSLQQNFEFDDLSVAKYGPGGMEGSTDADASDSLHADLTVPVAPAWDVRLSVKNTEATSNPAGYSYSPSKYVTFNAENKLTLDSQVIDFEAGHHMKLGQQDVRLFAGLRYMDLESSATFSYGISGKYGSASYAVARESELKAYGLRGGIETSIPLGKGFTANGLVAASAVTGDRENDIRYSYSGITYSNSLDDDDDDTWLGTELELSVTWDPSPESASGPTLSLGYSWNETYDVLSTSVMNTESEESDLTEEAIFVRVDFAL